MSDTPQQTVDMATDSKLPDPKRPFSARVFGSTLAKLEVLVQIWATRAKTQGEKEDVIEAIDMPHVVNVLLADAVDAELAPWGGMPKDKAATALLLKEVAAAEKRIASIVNKRNRLAELKGRS